MDKKVELRVPTTARMGVPKGIRGKYLSGLTDRQKIRNPHSLHIPSIRMDNSGEWLPTNSYTKFCIYCNSERVLPMRFSGLTLYECLYCGEKWRDSYNKPGITLRNSEWRDRRKKVGNRYGRILI